MTLRTQISALRRDVREVFPDEPGIVKGAGIVLVSLAALTIAMAFIERIAS